MRVIKPAAVKHGQSAVYALDFQPVQASGVRRLATAGGDSTVKIWDVGVLVGAQDATSDSLLATLDFHTKSVNVCRWSKDGAYLASGSDDASVIVYSYTPNATITQVFGSSAAKSKESWTRKWMLHGHRMDVLDIAWSVSNLLASASIDNRILIWNIPGAGTEEAASSTGGTLAPMRLLDGHSSFVKGVAFDPIGRFLASCGADNKLLIWSTETWKVVQTIDQPLRDSVDMTMFRRADWAPDGTSLCLTSAVKNSKPVGMMISRSSWALSADLVGHDAPTTCCRFYNSVFEIQRGVSSKPVPNCVVALGDQHGLLSVWSRNRNQPVIIARDMFNDAIVDISWTSFPYANLALNEDENLADFAIILGACSLDGSIALVLFEPFALGSTSGHNTHIFGRKMSTVALDAYYMTAYNQTMGDLIGSIARGNLSTPTLNAANGSSIMAMNSGVPLAPVSMKYAKPAVHTAAPVVAITSVSRPTVVIIDPHSPPPKPIISNRPKDGKKRIAPIAYGAPGGVQLTSNGGHIAHVHPNSHAASDPKSLSSQVETNVVASDANTLSTDRALKRSRFDSTPTGNIFDHHDIGIGEGVQTSSQGSDTFTADPLPSLIVGVNNAGNSNIAAQQQQQLAGLSRSGQVVYHSLPPGEVDSVRGRILEYSVQTDSIISRYSLSGTFDGHDARFNVNIPMEKSNGSGGGLPRCHNSGGDARLVVQILARPDSLSNSFGNRTSVVNSAGLSVMSIVQLRKFEVKGHLSSNSDWTAIIPGRATVGTVLRLPQPSSPKSNPYRFSSVTDNHTIGRFEGIALFGCSDGSLHIISLSSGQVVHPVLSLGAPVVIVSSFSLAAGGATAVESDKDGDPAQSSEYYCMAACSDGEVIVWKVDTAVYKPSNGDRPNSSGQRQHLLPTAFIAKRSLLFAGLTLLFKANLRPVVQSMRFLPNAPHCHVSVDSVFLTTASELTTTQYEHGAGEMVLAAVVNAPGADGGAWQVFRYVRAAGCWSRVADMKYILSSLSKAPSLSSSALDINTPSAEDITNPIITSVNTELEDLPLSRMCIPAKDVLIAARLLQQEKMQYQLGRIDCSGTVLERISNSGHVTAIPPFDWVALISLRHAEEKLSGFFFELQLQEKFGNGDIDPKLNRYIDNLRHGSVLECGDVSSCLRQWIQLSCRVGAIENIKWLAERMLALYGLPNKTPKMSNISPQGTVSSNDIATECSLVKDISLNAASANSETRERRFRIACLADHKAVINLYNGTILPAIGESGQASHPVIELLLQQLDDAMRAIFNTID